MTRVALPVCCLLLATLGPLSAAEFDSVGMRTIAAFGPWPPAFVADDSNRFSGDPRAVRFGERLFFDHALGGDSKLSCASCHDPGRAFTDGRALGQGRAPLIRNSSSLLDLAGNRWFGWGGENDSLWAQSIRPLLAVDEMRGSEQSIAAIIRGTPRYNEAYTTLTGVAPERVAAAILLADTGKALAAYQETLQSPRGAFDDFRDALLAGDSAAQARYPAAARRGLQLFVGAGRCFVCHFGPKFSNGEFADSGVGFFTATGVDGGRHDGIKSLRANPFNRLGAFNDGAASRNALGTRLLRRQHRNFGEFKVPALRGIAQTAPYMHNGSLADLDAVVRHYSEIDEERLHSDGEKILRPLRWSDRQIADMVAFLETL